MASGRGEVRRFRAGIDYEMATGSEVAEVTPQIRACRCARQTGLPACVAAHNKRGTTGSSFHACLGVCLSPGIISVVEHCTLATTLKKRNPHCDFQGEYLLDASLTFVDDDGKLDNETGNNKASAADAEEEDEAATKVASKADF